MATETKMENAQAMKTQIDETEERNVGAVILPRFVAIRNFPGLVQYIYWEDGSVINGEDSISDPRVKIEIESSKTNPNYVHLRFCYSNRYWQVDEQGREIIAVATQPEEDLSKKSSTLFSLIRPPSAPQISDMMFRFIHVQTGKEVLSGSRNLTVGVSPDPDFPDVFELIDWSTLVILPPRIAFQGYNEKYLRAVSQDARNYHRFDSDDPNERACGYEVHQRFDGHIRIRSDHWGMFWRRSPNWIWGDSPDTTGSNRDTIFWPVKIDDNTIALRNVGNNNFCIALTAEGKVDCLNAGSTTITNQARLVVQELVLERRIHNVRYRMEDSRIFDEAPYVAGSSSVANNTDQEASMSVEIEYTNEVSNTFSNSISVTAGITNTFEGGIPFIFSGKIEVSLEGTYTREWGQTVTTRTTVKASGSVVVPPRSVALVNYVGTRGACSVPFSYTQQDRSSTDGSTTQTNKIDGLFEGVNSYNFQFVVSSTRSI